MIYLDYNSTTPLDPSVLERMLEVSQKHFGNPSSIHSLGRTARDLIDTARESILKTLRAADYHLAFTSGGTEADNLGLRAVLPKLREVATPRILIGSIEHKAVIEGAKTLKNSLPQTELLFIAATPSGETSLDDLERKLTENCLLVSIGWVNNETGVIQPFDKIIPLIRSKAPRALIHTDAVQALGKIEMDLSATDVDLVSVSAHKIYGPKGVGALIYRKKLAIPPQIHGGAQERGLRPGTENVVGIVGFETAVSALNPFPVEELKRIKNLRERFEERMLAEVKNTLIHGSDVSRVGNTSSVSFSRTSNGSNADFEAEVLLMTLDQAGIAASAGSACLSGSSDPSHVLIAMGLPAHQAASTLRFSLGKLTTLTDVDSTIETLKQITTEKHAHIA